MAIVIALVILAVLTGGVGLLVEGLLWMLVIAAALLVVGAVLGLRSGSRPRA
jgi:hypothetical protein